MIGAFEPSRPLRAITPRPETITIVKHADGSFDVHVDEAVSWGCAFDEMLGEVARLALGHIPRYMRHVDAIIYHMERRASLSTTDTTDFEEVKP